MLLDGDAGEAVYDPMPFKLTDHSRIEELLDTRRGFFPRSFVDGLQRPGRSHPQLFPSAAEKFPASSRVGSSISQQLIIEPDGRASSPVLEKTRLEGCVYPGSLSFQPL